MREYKHNKITTACEIVRRIENWPVAFSMRLRRHHPGLQLLRFRRGLNVVCRGGTRDWDVVHELLFAGSYGAALQYLATLPGQPLVLDLGGNIGLFSLLAAATHPGAEIHSYEPGPPNFRLLEINLLANPALAERIHLHKQAVGGRARVTEWFFDDQNPGGSGLYGSSGTKLAVEIRRFADVVAGLPRPLDLAKIDIEGAEFELLEETPAETWRNVKAIALELHDDPRGTISPQQFLDRMRGYGYRIEEETVCSYFLHR